MADARIPVSRIIHTIHATTDIYGCRLRYQDALGGLVFAENYFPAMDRDCALLYVADHMIEPMAARNPEDMTKAYARTAARIGQSYHSFELKVPDGAAASSAFREAGVKVASDFGSFFFVKPESTGGIMLEVCELPMPNDPYDRPHWDPKVGTGHHCGVLRLDHIACVTADLEAVMAFFTGLVDGEVIEDSPTALPQPGRRVVIQLGDARIAFTQPDDPATGPLSAYLGKPSGGVYALVWQIESAAKARGWFTGERLGLRLTEEGCVSTGFAIDPADFFGARHEFVEGS